MHVERTENIGTIVAGFLTLQNVLFACFFEVLIVLFLVFLFLGGLKGQARWPFGPPHLALRAT